MVGAILAQCYAINIDEAKPHPDPKDYHEGPEAARRFESLVRRVIVVPHDEIKKREEAWKKAKKRQRKKARD